MWRRRTREDTPPGWSGALIPSSFPVRGPCTEHVCGVGWGAGGRGMAGVGDGGLGGAGGAGTGVGVVGAFRLHCLRWGRSRHTSAESVVERHTRTATLVKSRAPGRFVIVSVVVKMPGRTGSSS